MTKPAGQEAEATEVPPAQAAADDPFGLAPWLKDMPQVAIPPLMAHPVAAMAAATAIGFGLSSHFAGVVIGAMQGSAERMKAALDKAALDKAAEADVEALKNDEAAPVGAGSHEGAGISGEEPALVRVAEPPVPSLKVAKGRKPANLKTKAPADVGGGAPQKETAAARANLGPAASRTKKPATVRKGSGPNAVEADDLKVISGIGPKLEQALNGKGIFRFADIARWSASEAKRIEAELGLDGRIARDGWVEQAKVLAKARG